MEESSTLESEIQFDTPDRPKPWSFTHMWTPLDVSHFIRDVGFPQYAKCFINNMVNGRDIRDLTALDLQRLGVDNMMDAIRIQAYLKEMCRKTHYNFDNPDEPPNVSYCSPMTPAMGNGSTFSWLPPIAQHACMEMTSEDYRLPYRDQGSRYNRYHITEPSVHHWRNICTRKNDDFP